MILPEQLTDEGIAEFELSIEGSKAVNRTP
jgi:hypothetical protein